MESKLLSIILLCYYSKERIRKTFVDIKTVLGTENIPFEFIIMDDGSTDGSFKIAQELEHEYDNVIAYQLSRNYGSMYSMFAGLSVCKGACAIYVPDDEQQPYSSIVDMYRLWEEGNKVVIADREDRDDPYFSKLFSSFFYKAINTFSDGLKYPGHGTDTVFIDREIIDIINTRIHPINTNVVAEVLRLGYSPVLYSFKRPLGLNGNRSRWTFSKKMRLAKDIFFSSSSFPIKMIIQIGLFFSALSFVGILFFAYIRIFGNHMFWGLVVPGWTSLIIIICFFGGLILFSLGIISEYIWRIYDEVKGRPGFIIKKK